VIDYQLYEQISSGFPTHTPFVAGMAFQWCLTLEILDSIQSELGCNLEWVNHHDRIAEISKGYKLSKRASRKLRLKFLKQIESNILTKGFLK